MRRTRYAIIPTRNREEVLKQCLAAIAPQVDVVYILNNGEPFSEDRFGLTLNIQYVDLQPPNLSKFWNMGLAWCQDYELPWGKSDDPTQWDVAILNDDAVVPEGWFDAVSAGMRAVSAAAGCSGPQGALYTVPGPVPLHTRLQGYAFMVAGELGLRANEDIHWYFTDDWMDWESRKLGGMVMVQGFQVAHMHPNGQMTPEIHVQCAKDAQTFADIYGGMRPW